jgi:Zn-dependent protease
MNETLLTALALIPALVIAIVFHEVAHGWTALALGDPTAKEQRRLSLNPIRHIDPVGTLLVPGMLALAGGPIFGWAKPVPVMKSRLDNPRFGMMAVAAAGPGTNIVLAAIGAVALGLLMRAGVTAEGIGGFAAVSLQFFILINLFLAFFNLLPIPPFDGSHVLEGLLPRSWARAYDRLRPLGMVLFFALVLSVWLGPGEVIFERFIFPPVEWLLLKFEALAQFAAGAE